MRNKNTFKYPFTVSEDVGFNHNIHRLGVFNEYIENGTIRHDSSGISNQAEFSTDTAAGLFDEMLLNIDIPEEPMQSPIESFLDMEVE